MLKEIGGLVCFGIFESLGKTERFKPLAAAEIPTTTPDILSFLVSVGNYEVTQYSHSLTQTFA